MTNIEQLLNFDISKKMFFLSQTNMILRKKFLAEKFYR